MTTSPGSSSAPSRRPLLLVLGGCALLALCVLVVGGAGAGGWFLFNRSQPAAPEPAVEYILDASPRMAAQAEGETGTRLSVAQGVLAEIVRPADPDTTSGLRVFGTGVQANPCQDTDLVVPLAPANRGEIASRALEVQSGAAADAAVAEAMLAAIRDLAATQGPHTLVVVTGGADTCNAEAGQLIAQEATRAGIQLQTFVVGYQVPEDEAAAIRSLVDEAGSATYLGAQDADELREILSAIQKYVDDPATAFPTVTLGTPAAVGPNVTAAPNTTPGPTQSGVGPQPTAGGATAAPGTTGQPSGYAAQSACDHPYLPLRQGATWTYAIDGMTFSWIVTSVTGDLQQAEAVLQLIMDEGTIDYHWTCTSEGLTSYDFGSVNTNEGGFSFEVTNAEGTWLPRVELLVPGYSWVNNYTMVSSIDGGGQSLTVSSTVNETRTVVGLESMTSEAGTFDTLRVDSAGTYSSQIPGLPGTNFDTSSAAWFAFGIGMVRQTSTSSGTASTTTLLSYSIP